MSEATTPQLPALAWIRDHDQARSLLDPLRARILKHLREPGSATSVAATLGAPRQRINYHVRTLEEEGLLEHVEDRRKGNCLERIVRSTARRYMVDPDLFGPETSEAEHPSESSAGPFSSDPIVAAATRTLREVAQIEGPDLVSEGPFPSLSIESRIRFRSPHDEVEFANALRESLQLLRDRYHDPGAAGGRAFRITVGGHLDPAGLQRQGTAPAHQRQAARAVETD